MLRNFALPGFIVLSLTIGAIVKPGFFDPFSLLFTLGGAMVVTGFSYSKQQFQCLLTAVRTLFTSSQDSLESHIAELRRLTGLYRLEGLKGLENQERNLTDPFLKQGVELLVDLQSEETVRARLEHRLVRFAGEHEISRQILMTLGKLLPSFGLIGTLVGMVLLLGNLSSQDPKSLPSALGLAVLTTLYGAVAANVLVAPLLARLQSAAVDQEVRMRLTKEWVLLMLHGETSAIAHRHAKSLPVGATGHESSAPLAPLSFLMTR